MISNKYLEKLEFYEILKQLESNATTFIGKQKCLSLNPCPNREHVNQMLSETTEAFILVLRHYLPPLSEIPEIFIHLKRLQSNDVLFAKQLLELASILKISRELKEYFSNLEFDISFAPILSKTFNELYSNLNIEKKVFSILLDENNISDYASPTLLNIRKKIKKVEDDIKIKLNSLLNSKYIQDNIITLRNDRYVIPVKNEYRSEVKGFVHDISSSGSTIFIEPISVFELNNLLNGLKHEESIEIQNILKDISSLFYPIYENISNNINLIGNIDFIFAKAKFAVNMEGSCPIINNEKYINLISARHPLLDKAKAIPIDISIGNDFSSLVITGPNTGGKTVSLKTVGLLTIMGMCGLYIPAKEKSSIFVFDNVFADIGDNQNITESLSTFSSHMINIIEILNNVTPNSLILLDELGSGTDPIEGANLAISILEHLHSINCLTIATTHYPEIKNFALTTNGFKNASTEFNLETLSPTYKLLMGIPR